MNRLLLVGTKDSSKQYIVNLIQEKKIKKYNTFYYSEKFGIQDAKMIIRQLSLKIPRGDLRLFVISSEITLQAQNALLKTLEDLDDSSIIIFQTESEDEIIGTIKSRCFVMHLIAEEKDTIQSPEHEELVNSFLNTDNPHERLFFGLKISYEFSKNNSIEEINILLFLFDKAIKKLDKKRHYHAINMIGVLLNEYQLVKKNNINKQMYLESALLSSRYGM